MPFLGAMTTGWIRTPPATLRMEVAGGDKTVNTGRDFDRPPTSNHGGGLHQVRGNPWGKCPPCKFHNFWAIHRASGLELSVSRPDEPAQWYFRGDVGDRRHRHISLTCTFSVLCNRT